MSRSDFSWAAQKMAGECPGIRIRQASRVLTRVYDEALRPLGVQSSQLSVLVAVAMFGEDGAMLGSVANALAMERTTLTRNVRPLERTGLLRVARSPDDARTRVIVLTRAGERLIESSYPLWERVTTRLRASLGAKNMTSLRAGLTEVVAQGRRLERSDRRQRAS